MNINVIHVKGHATPAPEYGLPVGGPVGLQDPQPRAALLLQGAGGAEEEFKGVKGEPGQHSQHGEPVLLHTGGEAGVGHHRCPQYDLEEGGDSMQGGADYTQGSWPKALHGVQCGGNTDDYEA